MRTSYLWTLVAVSAALFSFAGCRNGNATAEKDPLPLKTFFPIKVGSQTVNMQLAIASEEMQRGLMGRRDLAQDQGMLFLYEIPTQMGFWMHNTPTPLDIGFFSPEGELKEIYQLLPFDEKTVRSHGDRLQYALEMNRGWYKSNGVKPGDKIDLAALAKAIEARGAKAHRYGIRPAQ